MLIQPEIEEFKKITLKVYGVELSDTEARDQGERLLRVIELMARTLDVKDITLKDPIVKRKRKV